MNCTDVRSALPDRLDGLLPTARAARLDAHLMQCQACAAARDRLAALRAQVYTPIAVEAPTTGLRARIEARASTSITPRHPVRRFLIPCAASFAAGVIVTLALIGRRVPEPPPTAAPAPTEIQEARPIAPPPLRRIF